MGLLEFRRDEGGCLGRVKVEKPLLEGGDEGNDRGREANLRVGRTAERAE